MKKLILVAVLAVGGCAGMDYAMTHYTGVEVTKFTYKEQVFRVHDKPEENRLMITPSIGNSAAAGATFGLASTPETIFLAASAAYLKSDGRRCKPDTIALIVSPQFEVMYSC